jgi:hypothetical protein
VRSFFNQRFVGVGIVVAVLMVFGVIVAIRARDESRKNAKNACINNLRMIDSCKKQWALEQRKQETDVPTCRELWDDMWRGYPEFNEAKLPSCPDDPSNSFRTSYQIRSVGELPVCLIDPKNHVLPPR